MVTIGDERIVRIGDTVVVTARRSSSGTWEGTPYTTEEWISEILIQGPDGRWPAAFAQKS